MRSKPFLQIVIFFALGVALSCGGKAGPAQTVKDFARYVESGNTDAAINLLSSKIINAIGKAKLEVSIAEESRRIKERGGIKAVSIEKEEINGDAAAVTSKVTYGNDETSSNEAKLIRENGQWKIDINK
jgi:hypothetical protein